MQPRPLQPALSGRVLVLKANFYPLRTLPAQDLYCYQLSSEQVPPTQLKVLFQHLVDTVLPKTMKHVRPVLDIHCIYTPRSLGFDVCDFDVSWGGETVKVTVSLASKIRMVDLALYLAGRTMEYPYEAIKALDAVLRMRPSLVTIGPCFYAPESAIRLSGGGALVQGYHQSLKAVPGQLLLNVDVSATAFYQAGPLIEIITHLLGLSHGKELYSFSDREKIRIERAIKGLKVHVDHRGNIKRKYRITKLTSTPAYKTSFFSTDYKKDISVADYFRLKYKRTLKYANLPCVMVGDPSKQIYLPMEVCHVLPGQRYIRKLNERQTAEMIRHTCQPPHVRSSKISAGVSMLQNRDGHYLHDFGIDIGSEMITVEARVLPSPVISYHPTSREPLTQPKEGSWNLRDKRVAQGMVISSWSVIVFGKEHTEPPAAVHKFMNLLVNTAEECGLFIENKQPPILYANPSGNIEQILVDAFVVTGASFQEKPQLLLCVLPNTNVALYAEIKRVTDTVIGVISQCIQSKHLMAAKRQYCANVSLKLNVKLGGINSFLGGTQLSFVTERPTIIIGADLTHPTAGSSGNPSIAALVGSMDAQCSKYSTSIRIQKKHHDIIEDMQDMVTELLRLFYKTTGAKPEKLLFYRHGSVENSGEEVFYTEMDMIRHACLDLEEGYMPTVTYVLVQKRHHARFFPTHSQDADRSGNMLPGTVVDTGVTHPDVFDFYLCSHPGLQGTSKPAHYHILKDENQFTADGIQELTYRLCYLYGRATRAVSVCPPVYYAQLVTARARFHMYGGALGNGLEHDSKPNGEQLIGGMVGGDFGKRRTRASPSQIIPVKRELSQVMYFM